MLSTVVILSTVHKGIYMNRLYANFLVTYARGVFVFEDFSGYILPVLFEEVSNFVDRWIDHWKYVSLGHRPTATTIYFNRRKPIISCYVAEDGSVEIRCPIDDCATRKFEMTFTEASDLILFFREVCDETGIVI